MHITKLYTSQKPVVSFEVFPPKKADDISKIYTVLEEITGLGPNYISVTYGAGGDGGKGDKTRDIAAAIRDRHRVESLAHLTCVGADESHMRGVVQALAEAGIENILALRGDLPEGAGDPLLGRYPYAHTLIRDILKWGDFCVGAACYPEGHIDADSMEQSIAHMLVKQEAGAGFFISQLCFQNDLLFRFLEAAKNSGVTAPISCGVMPILGRSQVQRMIFMCGVSLPSDIVRLLHKYEDKPDDLRKAGIEYAAEQVEGLIGGGVDGVHIYTMNQPDIAARHMERLRQHGYR